MLNSISRKFRYAVLLANIAGPIVLANELRRQLYSKAYFLGMELDLDKPILAFKTDVEYKLERGKASDIDEMLEIAKTLNRISAYELVMRKMFYDSGFCEFYVARNIVNQELCYMAWLLSCAEHPQLEYGIKGIPPVKENEVLMFNLFAFDKYRGTGLASSVDSMLCKLAMKEGYNRAIAYPPANNIAAVKAFEKIGFKKYGWKYERRLLFSVNREYYDDLSNFPEKI